MASLRPSIVGKGVGRRMAKECCRAWGNDGKESGTNGERIGGEAAAIIAGGTRGGHVERWTFILGARARGREGDGAEDPGRRRPGRADEHGPGSPGARRCGGMVFHERTVQAHLPGRREGRGWLRTRTTNHYFLVACLPSLLVGMKSCAVASGA